MTLLLFTMVVVVTLFVVIAEHQRPKPQVPLDGALTVYVAIPGIEKRHAVGMRERQPGLLENVALIQIRVDVAVELHELEVWTHEVGGRRADVVPMDRAMIFRRGDVLQAVPGSMTLTLNERRYDAPMRTRIIDSEPFAWGDDWDDYCDEEDL
jgi:hypothetical protein